MHYESITNIHCQSQAPSFIGHKHSQTPRTGHWTSHIKVSVQSRFPLSALVHGSLLSYSFSRPRSAPFLHLLSFLLILFSLLHSPKHNKLRSFSLCKSYSQGVGMDRHTTYSYFRFWTIILGIYRNLFQTVQGFKAINKSENKQEPQTYCILMY